MSQVAEVAITAGTKLCWEIGDCVGLMARRSVIDLQLASAAKVRSVSFTEKR